MVAYRKQQRAMEGGRMPTARAARSIQGCGQDDAQGHTELPLRPGILPAEEVCLRAGTNYPLVLQD